MNIHNGLTIRVQSAAGRSDSERVPSEREVTDNTAV